MTYCAERVKLLQKAGRHLSEVLLPEPFSLWYSDHSTGCQMTIVARRDHDHLPVWKGSIWYSSTYEFNDRDDVAGLQPDFAFAKPVIEKYFADLEAEVSRLAADRDRQNAERAAAAAKSKRDFLESIEQQLRGFA